MIFCISLYSLKSSQINFICFCIIITRCIHYRYVTDYRKWAAACRHSRMATLRQKLIILLKHIFAVFIQPKLVTLMLHTQTLWSFELISSIVPAQLLGAVIEMRVACFFLALFVNALLWTCNRICTELLFLVQLSWEKWLCDMFKWDKCIDVLLGCFG